VAFHVDGLGITIPQATIHEKTGFFHSAACAACYVIFRMLGDDFPHVVGHLHILLNPASGNAGKAVAQNAVNGAT